MFDPAEIYNEEYIKQLNMREEKKQVRKAANLLGVAFLLMTAIMVMWSFPVSLAAGLGFINIRKLYDVLSDPTVVQALQIVVSSLSFILAYWLYAKMMKTRITDVCAFKKPADKSLVVPMVLTGLGVCGLSNYLTSIAGGIFQRMGFEYELKLPENPTNPFGVVLAFVATAVTPALVEEFAMRGVVLGVLRKYGDGFAIIISSVVFGLMHGNFAQIPFAFILGVFFGYAVVKTGSVWTAVIIHFLNNLFSITIDYLTGDASSPTQSTIILAYLLILMLLGVVGLYLLSKKGEKTFVLDGKTSYLTEGQKIATALTAPVMIIVYVVVLIEATLVYV